MNEPIRLLDLEDRLAEDSSGAYRGQLIEALRLDLSEVKRRIDAGLSPQEFESADAYRGAIESAIEVVDKVWKLDHEVKLG